MTKKSNTGQTLTKTDLAQKQIWIQPKKNPDITLKIYSTETLKSPDLILKTASDPTFNNLCWSLIPYTRKKTYNKDTNRIPIKMFSKG